VLIPHLESRKIRLLPITDSDHRNLHGFLLRSGLESTLTLEAHEKSMASLQEKNVTAFMIQQKVDGRTVGCCSLSGPTKAGCVNAAIFTDQSDLALGVGADAMILQINYAFAKWENTRKVYCVTTDASIDRFDSELVFMPREMTLKEHGFFRGRYWDYYYYSIQRKTWEEKVAPFVNRLVVGTRPTSRGVRR